MLLFLVCEHLETLSFLLPFALVLHEPIKLLFVVVLESIHARSDTIAVLDPCLLLLPSFVLDGAI